MILTINIENTSTVVGCNDGSRFLFVEQISTSTSRTELEYAISFKNIIELYALETSEITGAAISSVVPLVTNAVRGAIKRIFQLEPVVIGPGVKTGLNIMVDHPSQVGSDLVANAVAGIAKYEAPMLIVNMGTATTISVINEKKQYVGGMIIPGMKVSLESLSRETAQLPQIGMDLPKKLIGTNTIDCMKSGVIYGSAACIDGMIKRIEEHMGQPIATVVATGQYIRHILPYCERKMCLDETLLLDGLRYIYEKNQR